MEYLIIYGIITLAFVFINAVIAGYNATKITIEDVFDSLFWPISIATLLGLLVRLIVQFKK